MNEERYIQFEQYLQEEMTVEERKKFEKQVLEDEEIAAEFSAFKEVLAQLDNKFRYDEERKTFSKNLLDISDKYFNKERPKRVLMRPWYFAVAASVVVLFGLFFFGYNPNPSFNDYNHPEQAHFTERSNTNVNLIQAEKAFNDGKFKEAVPFFEAVLKNHKTAEIQYYYGVSLLQINEYIKAETVFNELKSGTSLYREKSVWNLALIKLKHKDYKGCKQILQTISQDFEYYDEVQELLRALE